MQANWTHYIHVKTFRRQIGSPRSFCRTGRACGPAAVLLSSLLLALAATRTRLTAFTCTTVFCLHCSARLVEDSSAILSHELDLLKMPNNMLNLTDRHYA